MVGVGRHLRQMRDAEHLARRAERLQQLADGGRDRAADAGIHLVEHQRRHAGDLAGRHRDRQRHARQLAARGDLGQRSRRLRRMRGDIELDVLETVARRFRQRRDTRLEAPAAHRQRLHRGRHMRRQLARRQAPLPGQRAGKLAIRSFRSSGACVERGDVGVLGQLREPRQRVGEQARQRFRAHAVLARRIVQRGQALLGPRQRLRVGVEPAQVLAQRARDVVELGGRRRERRRDVAERRVVRRRLRQPLHERVKLRGDRSVAVDRGLGSGGGVDQRRGMGEARLRRGEIRPFVVAGSELGELVAPRREVVAIARQCVGANDAPRRARPARRAMP